ncbi:MAG: hypothetical protein Q9181_002190 [Wetmoreana brouardii]
MTTQSPSAQTCADLHNSLIRRIAGSKPETKQDLVSILQAQQAALYSKLQGTQLLEFLSLIGNYDSTNNDTHFTPQVLKPDPRQFLFYGGFDVGEQYPEHIHLYPDAESSNNGGIIYDPATDLATWAFFPPWPEPDDWITLSEILNEWLQSWDTCKFFMDEGMRAPAVRSWVPRDVEDALGAWEPPTEDPEPILQQSQLERVEFHPFATAFLSRAPLPPPRIKWIAPGITPWIPNSFRYLMEGEPPSSPRRQWLPRRRFEREQIPVLLFPAFHSCNGPALRVPSPVPPGTQGNAQDFDKEWGFGKFTYDRLAGLYLFPSPEIGAADAVIVLEESGRDDWGQRRGRYPKETVPSHPADLAANTAPSEAIANLSDATVSLTFAVLNAEDRAVSMPGVVVPSAVNSQLAGECLAYIHEEGSAQLTSPHTYAFTRNCRWTDLVGTATGIEDGSVCKINLTRSGFEA